MKVLITGATGMLGQNLSFLLKHKYDIYLTGRRKKNNLKNYLSVDFSKSISTNKKKLSKFVDPDVILHCAAITDVDYCEKNHAESVFVNSKSVDLLRDAFNNTKIIYISTDAVFGGSKNPNETSDRFPINHYGKTKKYGEDLTLKSINNIVIRTTPIGFNYFDNRGFLNWVVNSYLENKEIKLFEDAIFNPIYVKRFSDEIIRLIKNNLSGVWHINGSENYSKYNFGKALFKNFNYKYDKIIKHTIKKSKLIAKRPTNQVIICSKFEKQFNVKLPNLNENIEMIKADYERYFRN